MYVSMVSNRRALHAHVWMRIWMHYVVYDNNAVGTPVVSISDCPKLLLTGSVPYLKGIHIHATHTHTKGLGFRV